ncbi:MAG: LD-carboxypeptidase [Eubacterium ramulus]
MRYPEFLKKNGCIGFVAPSFGCNIEPYKTAFGHALDKFEKMGYRTELGPNCYEGCGIGISNTPEKCGQELMEYYCNDTSDVLISCGGGELMCEDLPYVDFEKIKEAKPKWYLGYSDNTNMTFLLTTLCDVASIYGPCAAAFGMEPWHPAIQDAFDVLTGEKLTIKGYDLYEKEGLKDEENPLVPYNVTEPCIRKKVPDTDIKMEGRLVGGCLDVLTLLLGTKYDKVQEFTERYKEDGIIWFY